MSVDMGETNMEIKGRNVNDCYRNALTYIMEAGVLENSRNGRVLVAPEPVMTTYERPTERVLFDPKRDANPFFHLMEAIWMLAGEKHAAWPVQFNKQMAEYARDDGTYEGAYGYRWRRHFHIDQIQWAVEHLRANPESRRCVITMFDGFADRSNESKDIPCNTHLYLDMRGHHLNMTVCNRSNDLVWGCFGANAVHFSILQEVIAAGLNRPVGLYRQFSNNLHVYVDIPKVQTAVNDPQYEDRYRSHGYHPFPLVRNYGTFLLECEYFLKNPDSRTVYDNPFFYYVARPMYLAWMFFKAGDDRGAYSELRGVEDPAWRYAAEKWLTRRTK
jgi:thymidylate synthase